MAQVEQMEKRSLQEKRSLSVHNLLLATFRTECSLSAPFALDHSYTKRRPRQQVLSHQGKAQGSRSQVPDLRDLARDPCPVNYRFTASLFARLNRHVQHRPAAVDAEQDGIPAALELPRCAVVVAHAADPDLADFKHDVSALDTGVIRGAA